jgi:hypothetical protein
MIHTFLEGAAGVSAENRETQRPVRFNKEQSPVKSFWTRPS